MIESLIKSFSLAKINSKEYARYSKENQPIGTNQTLEPATVIALLTESQAKKEVSSARKNKENFKLFFCILFFEKLKKAFSFLSPIDLIIPVLSEKIKSENPC